MSGMKFECGTHGEVAQEDIVCYGRGWDMGVGEKEEQAFFRRPDAWKSDLTRSNTGNTVRKGRHYADIL